MLRSRSIPYDRSNAGFTLPEGMLAIAVLVFIVAALTQAVVSGQMHAYDGIHQVRATSLAEAMMDEVLSKPYDDPDGASVDPTIRSWDQHCLKIQPPVRRIVVIMSVLTVFTAVKRLFIPPKTESSDGVEAPSGSLRRHR